MKINNKRTPIVLICCLIFFSARTQNKSLLQVEKFTLENGLTVYLNVDPAATRVYGAVQVNSGSIHESPNATGMSHYLEHMLFKGTQTMGTLDYEKEKPHYDAIKNLYDKLESTTNKKEREQIQKEINQQAIATAKYGLPNEFSILMKSIGASELSAFADYDITFYHSYFPTHQMEKWLDINVQRFLNPVFRTFQSELEVVYEEKNRYDDDYENAIYDAIQEMLYPNYAYGLWPVIGKTAHLKNPSLSKMHAFYEKNYVAKNMALILSGNFNKKTTRALIEAKFSLLSDAAFEPMAFGSPPSLKGVVYKDIKVSPYPLGAICFPTVSPGHSDRPGMEICQYLLSNEQKTGILDQFESTGQIKKVTIETDDHGLASAFIAAFIPNDKQSIDEGEEIIFNGIQQLNNGQIDDELITLAKLNLIRAFWLKLENLEERSLMIAEAHYLNIDWDTYLDYPSQIGAITKERIVQLASQYFASSYGVLKSEKGRPKKDDLKKPKLEPVTTDQSSQSSYAKQFKAMESGAYKPAIIDFREIESYNLPNGQKVTSINNPINDLFKLDIQFKTGLADNPQLAEAVDISKYLGAGAYSRYEFKKAFEKIGCTYAMEIEENETLLQLEGAGDNIGSCLQLAHILMSDPKADQNSMSSLINEYKTKRSEERQSPFTMGFALIRYGVFDTKTKFLRRRAIDDIKNTDVNILTKMLSGVYKETPIEITYTGSLNKEELNKLLMVELDLSRKPKTSESTDRKIRSVNQNIIYLIDDKKVRQNQVYFYVQGDEYNPSDYPLVKAFNTFYGESLTGVVYQEIREYRSLSYSTFARFIEPDKKSRKGYLVTGFGCQSDKTNEAIEQMLGLIKSFPEREGRLEGLRSTMIAKLNTEYPNFRQMGEVVRDLKRRGHNHDPNEDAYNYYKKMRMEDLAAFFNKQFREKPYVLTIYGNKSSLDLDKLASYGEIVELDVEDILVY